MSDRTTQKSILTTEVARVKSDIREKEESLKEAEINLNFANSELKVAKEKLQKLEAEKQEQIDALWNSLNVTARNLIQVAYWKAETNDFPGILDVVGKIIIKQSYTFKQGEEIFNTFSYFKVFNPVSPNSGIYKNEISKGSVLFVDDPRFELLDKAIVGDGVVIELGNGIQPDYPQTVIENFLPVFFFFVIEKKMKYEKAAEEAKKFFEKITTDFDKELYKLL